jgi:hypothetical protein
MGGICSTNKIYEKCVQYFINLERKVSDERPKGRGGERMLLKSHLKMRGLSLERI